MVRGSSIENRARGRIRASEPREDDIQYDLTIEKLEIARTVGMVTGFDAHQTGVTVRRSAHVSEADLRSYLEPLLQGLVAQQAIVIEGPLSNDESIGQGPVCWQRVESGSSLPRRRSHLDVLATAGAMLICAAVVLNVAPFGNTPKPPERIPAASLFELESRPGPAAQAAARPEGLRAVAEASDLAKPATTAAQVGSPPVERALSAEEAKAQDEGLQQRVELSVLARHAAAPAQFSLASVERMPAAGVATTRGEDPQQNMESMDLAKLATTAAQFTLASADWVSSAGGGQAQHAGRQQGVGRSVPAPEDHADNADPAPMARSTIVGVWAPDAGTCSAERFRDGVLPTVITLDGAWAGDTFCLFTKQQQTEDGLRVVAKCSSPRERWTSQVRLTVNDHRLTWTSKRGVQAYARCTPDLLMAGKR